MSNFSGTSAENYEYVCSGVKQYGYCLNNTSSLSLISVNAIEIVINVFHFVVLTKMKKEQTFQNYILLLQHIAMADIIASAMYILRTACSMRLLSIKYQTVNQILSASDTSLVTRFYILATACMERMIALAYPLTYETSWFIRYLNLILIADWIMSLLTSVVRDVIYNQDICIDIMFGPSNTFAPKPTLMTFIPVFVQIAITVFTLTRVSIELFRLRKRSTTTIQQREIKQATIYIFVITVVYFTSLIPSIIAGPLLAGDNDNDIAILTACHLCSSSYGFINTVIYGVATKIYRTTAKRLLTCSRRLSNTVGLQ